MLKAARKVVKGMTALDAWDYTAYPHEQTMWDNEYMDRRHCRPRTADPVDVDGALAGAHQRRAELERRRSSKPSVVDRFDLTRHDPDYDRVTWGKLGKLINYFDMTPVMARIEDGKYPRQYDGADVAPPTRRPQPPLVNMAKALDGAGDPEQGDVSDRSAELTLTSGGGRRAEAARRPSPLPLLRAARPE